MDLSGLNFQPRVGVQAGIRRRFGEPENYFPVQIVPSKEEIDNIIKNVPSGKLSGLDGFNSDFMKKC
jgi:hypothetical protein